MSDLRCQEEYVRRIHKVQDYIESHLSEPMSIEELSMAAGFSKYHFSRIFQGIRHESLAHYVSRIRMERAAFLLVHRADKNVTDVAYELGFSDSSVFSRVFRKYYGVGPRKYRQEYSKNCQEPFLLSEYNKGAAKKEGAEDRFPIKGEITMENLSEKQLAYVRHTGTCEMLAKEYAGLLKALFTHAQEQRLLVEGENWVLAIYHDNPEFGEAEQFRTSICLTVPDEIPVREDGILGKMKLEGGLYAVGHFRILKSQYPDAWNYMYQEWVTGSGYVPRDAYPFEVYENAPEDKPDAVHLVDIYVPVEPISF